MPTATHSSLPYAASDSEVLPEEEALFREFQSYVRAVSAEVTRETVQELQHNIREWQQTLVELETRIDGKLETKLADFEKRTEKVLQEIEDVVRQSRTNYQTLFDPAVKEFETKSTALVDHAEERNTSIKVEMDQFRQTFVASHAKKLIWLYCGVLVLILADLALNIYPLMHK